MSRRALPLALGLVALWPLATQAQTNSGSEISGPHSGRAVRAGVTPTVAEIQEQEALRTGPPQLRADAREINKLNTVVERPLNPVGPAQGDGALQTSSAERGEAVTVTPLPATSAASAAENEFTYAFDA